MNGKIVTLAFQGDHQVYNLYRKGGEALFLKKAMELIWYLSSQYNSKG